MSTITRLTSVAAAALLVAAIVLALPSPGAGPGGAPSVPSASAVAATLPLSTLAIPSALTPSVEPTGVECCALSPTPFHDGALQESDRFWERWLVPIHVYLPHDATSLADNVQTADLVVRGRMTNLYIGEYWRGRRGEEPYPLAYVRIEIAEVLKGEPVSRTFGAVEVGLGRAGSNLEEIRAGLPAGDNVWFLKGPLGYEGRDLPPQTESEIAPFAYVTTNDYQGVLREINGAIEVVGPAALAEIFGPDHFPLPLDGTSFAVLVEQVRALAQLPEATPLLFP